MKSNLQFTKFVKGGGLLVLMVSCRNSMRQIAFHTKPTDRQVRKFKKWTIKSITPKPRKNPHGRPVGYEMAGKDGYGNDYYYAFIARGWTDEQMINHGYLRKVQP